MASPPTKRCTVTANAADADAAAADQSQSESSTTKDKEMKMMIASGEDIDVKNADATTPPPPSQEAAAAAAAAAPEGLILLYAASQVETTPKAEAERDVTTEEAPSTIRVFRDGGRGTAEGRYGSSRDAEEASPSNVDGDDSENLAAAAFKNDVKSFPQILQDILATQEYQPIVHWLPDGFSFIIADKQQFSDVILPKYFREALFHSFVRKLNRWGFRRVKSRHKGEESSFANVNFVRDKPWLCLKMKCNSKPTYHKGPSTKKNAAGSANKLAKAARIVVPARAPPRSLSAGGMVDASRAFVATGSRVSVGEYERLPLPKRPIPTVTTAAGSLPAAVASNIQERQHLAFIPPQHHQRIFHERQILIAQMRQRHQLEVEWQRLNAMSSHIDGQFAGRRNINMQSAMMAKYTRDLMSSKNIYYRRERK